MLAGEVSEVGECRLYEFAAIPMEDQKAFKIIMVVLTLFNVTYPQYTVRTLLFTRGGNGGNKPFDRLESTSISLK